MTDSRGQNGLWAFNRLWSVPLFALAYALAATLGLQFASTGVAHFWPPVGLYLGVLLVTRRSHWPLVFLGAFCGNIVFDFFRGTGVSVSLGFSCANALQALAGAWLIRRLVSPRPTLASLPEFFGVLLLGGVVGSTLGATAGAATLWFSGLDHDFVSAWLSWWASVAMATMLITPLVLSWAGDRVGLPLRDPRRWAEAVLLAALILAAFAIGGRGYEVRVLPLLLWAGIRFGRLGATAVTLLVALATAFVAVREPDSLLTTQLFLGATNFVALVPAIVLDQRARALERLRDAEERQRTFASATFEGLVITQGDRIVDVNEQLVAMVGIGRDQLVGERFSQFVRADSRTWLLEGGATEPQAFPLTLLRIDGGELQVEARARELGSADQRTRVIALRDLTERRAAEEAQRHLEALLRQSQKMEALGTLAGGIAHDLNNTLAAIMGFGELAEAEAEAENLAAVRETIGDQRRATLRGADLVKNILTFARRQTHPQSLVDLRALVEETAPLLHLTLPKSHIELEIDPATPPVRGDSTQLQQVIINLSTNASHAMRMKQGRLRVVLGRGPPNDDKERSVRLSVSDDGDGMNDETQRRLFEPFFTTKTQGEGTGLGMAIVHGIVFDHGGCIEVQSTLGRGTTVHIDIPPAANQAATQTVVPRPKQAGRTSLHVLFVDDEPAICRIIDRLLTKRGYQVTTCLGSELAWRTFCLEPGRFDVVVTDLAMPVMTGLELARAISRVRPELPILLATGNSTGVGETERLESGIREVLLKPLLGDELVEALDRSCGGV